MRNASGLALIFGLLLSFGNGQSSKPGCEGSMRLMSDHATLYLEYVRTVEKGRAYLIALHNNFKATITVATPCEECKHFPCKPESATPFQPLYRVNGLTGTVLVPNQRDMVCSRSIAPGESAEFAVPKKYLPHNSAIFVPFEYEWENGTLGEPQHYLEINGPNNLSEVPR